MFQEYLFTIGMVTSNSVNFVAFKMHFIKALEMYLIKFRETENVTFNVLIILSYQGQILFLTWIRKGYKPIDRKTDRQSDIDKPTILTDICTQTCISAQAHLLKLR